MTKGRKRLLAVTVPLVVALVAARIALPTVVRNTLNKRLAANTPYSGHIDDVDIALWRGAYVIHGMKWVKVGGSAPVPFADIDTIDLSVEWRALLHGQVRANVELDGMRIHFVNGPTDAAMQAGQGTDWRKQLRALAPVRIDRFAVHRGQIHFEDYSRSPQVDISADDIELEAYNLTNSAGTAGSLVATVDAHGHTLGGGDFVVHTVVDPYADEPSFDMDGQLRHVDLTKLNSFIEAYGKFDVHRGQLDVFTELACEKGRVHGYVKPLLTEVVVLDLKQDVGHDSLPKLGWEAVVGVVKDVLTNPRTHDVGTEVNIDGPLASPKVGVWGGVWRLFKNAFVHALFDGLDNRVSLGKLDAEAQKGRK